MSSLYGAMFSGVTGLNSQTQSMAMISDNVANVNTTGYKEVTARFSSLVTNSISQGLYTSGGVRSLPLQIQDKQGLLQGSSTSTDIAINGDGFFVVADVPQPDGASGSYSFTRAGSFRTDDDGNLVNTAGMYLQAWPYNSEADNTNTAITDDGIVYGTDGLPVNKTDLDNVEPVNMTKFTGIAEATTTVDLRINLDASQVQQTGAIDYLESNGGLGGIPSTSTVVNGTQLVNMNTMSGGDTTPDFQRSITIYDAQGVSHDLTLNFLKKGVDPNAAQLTETVSNTSTTGTGTTLVVPSLVGRTDIPADGGTVSYANSTATGFTGSSTTDLTYTAFNANTGTFTFGSSSVWSGSATADITYPVYQSVANQWAVEMTSSDAYNEVQSTSGTVSVSSFAAGTTAGTYEITIDMDNNTGTDIMDLDEIVTDGNTNSGGGSFTLSGATDTELNDSFVYQSVTRNGSELTFVVTDDYLLGETLSATQSVTMDITYDAVHQDGLVGFGTVVFNTDGSLDTNNSTMYVADYTSGSNPSLVYNQTPFETAADYEIAWSPTTTGASGSDTSALEPQTVQAINFGSNGQTDGLSQFQGTSVMYSHDVDGALFGSFAGVTVDSEGWVVANFSNGLSMQTYKIPLATVPNPAGLANNTGNTYTPTADSGTFNLNEAGTGDAGLVAGAALEGSTVDLGTEFTNMIITQRAYSATSKIITTADEMLDELVRLKR